MARGLPNENLRRARTGLEHAVSPPNPRAQRIIITMASMKRGVGYCENTDCEDYAKGVFLLNHGDTFYCPRCR